MELETDLSAADTDQPELEAALSQEAMEKSATNGWIRRWIDRKRRNRLGIWFGQHELGFNRAGDFDRRICGLWRTGSIDSKRR